MREIEGKPVYTTDDKIYELFLKVEDGVPYNERTGYVDLSDILIEDGEIKLRGAVGFHVPYDDIGDDIEPYGHSLGLVQVYFNIEECPPDKKETITQSELLEPIAKTYGEPNSRFVGMGSTAYVYKFVLGKRKIVDEYLDGNIEKEEKRILKTLVINSRSFRKIY